MKETQVIYRAEKIDDCDRAFVSGTPFEKHYLWDEIDTAHQILDADQDALLKAEVESPSVAANNAQSIAIGWRSLHANGALTPNQPCYLLELEAANGRFASLLLTQLQSILSPQEWALFKPRYLLADSRAERVSECWQHSTLRPWIEQGHLEPVEYDARKQRFINLKSRRLILAANSIANPLVVIANGVFSGMRQSLHHVHYGKCFSAQLKDAVATKDSTLDATIERTQKYDTQEGESERGAYDYLWNEEQAPHFGHPLLPRYTERLDSGLVLIPQQMFEVIGRLTNLTTNGTLLLSNDRGFFGERRLREQSIPEMGPYTRYFLPINGHALSWHIESLGGNVTHYQSANDCPLHSLMWCPASKASAQLDSGDLVKNITYNTDAIVRRMCQLSCQSNELITADQLMSLLQLSDYDHHILFTHMGCLFDSLAQLDASQRISWRDTVTTIWRQYYLFKGDAQLLRDFGLLSMRLGAWDVAKQCLSYVINQLPNDIESRYYLALCLLHLGERDAVERQLLKCLEVNAGYEAAIDLMSQLGDWRTYCQKDHCYEPNLGRDHELSLHPLAGHYAEEFLYQYRDPSIAVMASLPDFDSVDEFEEWRQQQERTSDRGLYAVVHREHGLLGVVSLRWYQGAAFFYFWIGADYQGQGYGQRAAKILFSMAEQTLGICRIYTYAFDDNSRSFSALNELGFQPLPFKAKEPDDAYRFFSTTREPSSVQYGSLTSLLSGIESPIELLSNGEHLVALGVGNE
ncbi:MAG: GNAT family N-acetyltransferase [Arenicella sp.]|nr:GNAT family N-acetyltransferase [Arenicella sp.]